MMTESSVVVQPFDVGHVQMTEALRDALRAANHNPDSLCNELVQRHVSRDWGDITLEQRTVNEAALAIGRGVIKSSFAVSPAGDVWVLTSLDQLRGAPTITYVMLAGQSLAD